MANRSVEIRRRLYRRLVRLLPLRFRHTFEYLRMYRRFPKKAGTSHSERMFLRTLTDASSILTDMCSKVTMKQMIISAPEVEVHTPQTQWFGPASELSSALELLPTGNWVLKPNNLGGGVAHFLQVYGETPEVPNDFFGSVHEQELAFNVLAPVAWRTSMGGYLIEEKIGEPGATLRDYKVHIFSGVPRMLSVYDDRDASISVSHFLLPHATEVMFSRGPKPPRNSGLTCAELDELCFAAKRLSPALSYIRIDFYFVDGSVWFGEYSPFGQIEGLAGRRDIDELLGSWWNSTGAEA